MKTKQIDIATKKILHQNHFARTFRKIHACSPTAFRASAPRPGAAPVRDF